MCYFINHTCFYIIGVPVKEAVAGIAIGLISKVDTASQEIIEYKILTDLLV